MQSKTMKQGWEIKKLGECFEYIKNGANIKQERGAGGIPITRIETLSGGVFNRDRLGYADIKSIDKYHSYVMESGDLLLSHINSKSYIGRVVVYVKEGNETIIHGMNLLRLKVIPDLISPFYMYYYSQTHKFKSQIANRRKDAVNQSSISVADLKTIDVPVPPREEQERIVAELDCLSSVIERKREQLRELDALAQSIFYTMFGNPITNEKGWEVKKLGEVCDVRDGTHDSPKYLECSDYVLITSKNITNDGNIDFSTANYISKEDYDAINKRSYVESGDIIMAMIGTIGKPIIVKATEKKFCIKNVALIKFGCSTMVINTYIQAMLNNPDYGQYIQSQNKGGTQKFVALGTIRNLPIPLPSMEIQQLFAERIDRIEQQKELIKKSILETETLFNARMDYYFN